MVKAEAAKAGRWKGLPLDRLEAFGVTQTPDGIAVPYLQRDGQPFRTKLFPPNGRPRWLDDGKGQIPYGLEQLATPVREAIVLTEGESDALALRLAFPDAVVLGIPGATSWRTEWRTYVEDFPRIYLSFDGDDAGEELRRAVKADVPNYRPIPIPEGADTRDVLQKLGKRAYKVLVEVADADWEARQCWRRLNATVKRAESVRRLIAEGKP